MSRVPKSATTVTSIQMARPKSVSLFLFFRINIFLNVMCDKFISVMIGNPKICKKKKGKNINLS